MARNGVSYPALSLGSKMKDIMGTIHFSLFSDMYDEIPGNQLFLKFVLPENCQVELMAVALSVYYEILEYFGIQKPNIVLELAHGWPICFPSDEALSLEGILVHIDEEDGASKYCSLLTS